MAATIWSNVQFTPGTVMFGAIARRRYHSRVLMGQRRRETRSTSQIKDRLSLLIFRGTREMARKGSKNNPRKRKIATRPLKQTESWSQRSKFHLGEAQRLSRTGHWVLAVSSQRIFWSPELFRIFD